MATHTMTVTCRTPGCGNVDLDIDVSWDDSDPSLVPADVVCGVCGFQITDTRTADA